MSLLTAFVFGIGPIVGKALLKSLLKDYPVLSEIAPDLLDQLRDKAIGERGVREASRQITTLGETIAASMRPLFDEARLDDSERVAVLRELLLTLNQADISAEQLVESRMDLRRVAHLLTNARPNATTTLTAAGADLYEHLLREASIAIRCSAAELAGYASLRDGSILQDQERLLNCVETLLRQPDEASARFEAKYREVIQHELNKLELFGVRRLTDVAKKQSIVERCLRHRAGKQRQPSTP